MTNQSEIARLREQIDREIEALQQIKNGFARVADHETIMNHYRTIDVCYKMLAEQVGDEKAIDLVCEKMEALG